MSHKIIFKVLKNSLLTFHLSLQQDSATTSTVQAGVPVQKIITSTGQVITQQVQGNIISSANLQQLLQRGNVQTGQKIVVQSGPGGVQKLLVASPQQAQQVQQTGEKRIIIQNASGQQQQYILQSQSSPAPQQQQQQQYVTIGGQKLILQTSGGQQQMQQIKTVASPQVQQQTQQIQFQIQDQQQQQPQQQQQIVVQQNNGNNLAQQLAQGKIQVMNLNGQQVLVKSVGNNQSVIVGQVKTSTSQVTPVKQTMQTTMVTSTPNQQQHQQIVKTVQIPSLVNSGEAGVSEQAMLAGHPPGTIVKCVTAQVMQTPSGPRIVLQGLQGSDISPQQSQVLQQQVKQQLMKGKNLKY
jgi:nucleosome-remodeling factor subunit BPTF